MNEKGVFMMKKAQTKVYKSGNSQAIILKKSILQEAQIKIGDEVNYYVDQNNRIILEKNSDSFQEKWHDFVNEGGTYYEKELDWNESAGREVW